MKLLTSLNSLHEAPPRDDGPSLTSRLGTVITLVRAFVPRLLIQYLSLVVLRFQILYFINVQEMLPIVSMGHIIRLLDDGGSEGACSTQVPGRPSLARKET